MSEEKRVRRTPEQIAADLDVQIEKLKDSILELENKKAASATEFDNKIAAVKEKIAKLEAKKKDVLTPKKRKPRKSKADQIKLLVRQAQKSGMKLDEIADKLGMDLEIVKTEWDGLTPALLSGNIDVIIAGMSPTAERKMTIDFTDSYYDTELTVVVRKDSAFASAKNLADLAGAKITGQMSTFHYDMIDQIEGAVKMPAMETFPTMIVAVSSGAIDGYVADRPGAVSATSANPDLTYVTFDEGQGFTVSPDDAQIAVGVRQGSELKEQINEILAGISAEERNDIMDAVVLAQPLSE